MVAYNIFYATKWYDMHQHARLWCKYHCYALTFDAMSYRLTVCYKCWYDILWKFINYNIVHLDVNIKQQLGIFCIIFNENDYLYIIIK